MPMVVKGEGKRPFVHDKSAVFWMLIWPYRLNLEMCMPSDPDSPLPETFLEDPKHKCTHMYELGDSLSFLYSQTLETI